MYLQSSVSFFFLSRKVAGKEATMEIVIHVYTSHFVPYKCEGLIDLRSDLMGIAHPAQNPEDKKRWTNIPWHSHTDRAKSTWKPNMLQR